MIVPDAKRLKEHETENARLKKLLAAQVLENEVMKDVGERTGPTGTGPLHGRQSAERTPGAGGRTDECQRTPYAPRSDRSAGVR